MELNNSPVSSHADIQAKYDTDYFDSGEKYGKSLYKGYISAGYLPEIVRPKVDLIVRSLAMKPGYRVLDFGCACGYFVRCLREDYDINSYGVDVSLVALNSAPSDLRKYLHSLDEHPLTDFGDLSFDVVLAKDVLEHIPPAELERTVAELRRIGKEFFVSVPVAKWDGGPYIDPHHEQDATHVNRFTRESWLKILDGEARPLAQVSKGLKGHNIPNSNLVIAIS